MGAIHRWRAVIDFHCSDDMAPDVAAYEQFIRAFFTFLFPLGVVEGYPDVYDQDEKRAKIETPFHA